MNETFKQLLQLFLGGIFEFFRTAINWWFLPARPPFRYAYRSARDEAMWARRRPTGPRRRTRREQWVQVAAGVLTGLTLLLAGVLLATYGDLVGRWFEDRE